VVGVGNCASALVQGVTYYKGVPTTLHPRSHAPRLGGYHVGDIEFRGRFDIDANKVGLGPGRGHRGKRTTRFALRRSHLGVPVQRGMTHDGLGHYLSRSSPRPRQHRRYQSILRETGPTWWSTPAGGQRDVPQVVRRAGARRGCGFVNCIPVFIAGRSTGAAASRTAAAGGGRRREVAGGRHHHPRISPSSSWTAGCGSSGQPAQRGRQHHFYNMLERQRLHSKKISKTDGGPLPARPRHGRRQYPHRPGDYVPWLEDRNGRTSASRAAASATSDQRRAEARGVDSPNSAGVVMDATLVQDRDGSGIKGALLAPSAYLMNLRPSSGPTGGAHAPGNVHQRRRVAAPPVVRAL